MCIRFVMPPPSSALTLLEPPGFGNFHKKNSSFRLPYQCPSSSAHCARELFNNSNGSASLVDCTRKKIFAWGVRFFCEWRHKWRPFWPTLPGPGRQPLGGSISLKFLLETRLQSESFDTLDDLLLFTHLTSCSPTFPVPRHPFRSLCLFFFSRRLKHFLNDWKI